MNLLFWKKPAPIESTADSDLRKIAAQLRTNFTALVQETLVPDLNPLPEDFEASKQLADAIDARADSFAQLLQEFNDKGKIEPASRRKVIDSSRQMETALKQFAKLANKIQVKSNNPEFREAAGHEFNALLTMLEATLESLLATEHRIFFPKMFRLDR